MAPLHPRTRPDLIRMVPARLLRAGAAGVGNRCAQLLGAIGLMVPRAPPAAATA